MLISVQKKSPLWMSPSSLCSMLLLACNVRISVNNLLMCTECVKGHIWMISGPDSQGIFQSAYVETALDLATQEKCY